MSRLVLAASIDTASGFVLVSGSGSAVVDSGEMVFTLNIQLKKCVPVNIPRFTPFVQTCCPVTEAQRAGQRWQITQRVKAFRHKTKACWCLKTGYLDTVVTRHKCDMFLEDLHN